MDGQRNALPAVMVFAGIDPTGGAGLQADIETVISMGGHPLPVATAITVQDTVEFKSCTPVNAIDVVGQARAVLEDAPVAAFKIGLIASLEVAEAIHAILLDYPDIPVVHDPVFSSESGTTLVDDDLIETLVTLLAPRATVITPGAVEARRMAPEADSVNAIAHQILSYGCGAVLITGAQAQEREMTNRLYSDHHLLKTFRWDCPPGAYHGAGCTLASALATLLAHGLDCPSAVAEAQNYTWRTLREGYRLGHGRRLPNRLYWARRRTESQPR